FFFFFQAEDGIRYLIVTGVQTCALPISVLETVKRRFREELDYSLEAERQEAFRAFHAGDPTIRVPAVVRDRSARHVLTSEFVREIGRASCRERVEVSGVEGS